VSASQDLRAATPRAARFHSTLRTTSAAWATTLIQKVVDDLTPHLKDWSIRKILWQTTEHYGHAHIDFYPMIAIHKWCATRGVTPPWRYSDGHEERRLDPAPENGAYNGEDIMPAEQWHQMIDALFLGRPDEFQGDSDYWKHRVPEDSPEWVDFWAAFVRVIS